MATEKNPNKAKNSAESKLKDARTKYYLEMLDLKIDSNMTRVYSIIKKSSFLNNTN